MMQISRTLSCLILALILVLGAATAQLGHAAAQPHASVFSAAGCPGQDYPTGRD